MLMFATVRSYILTFRVHSLFRVSIWYSSLWSVVLLSCFWCFNEIFDAVEMDKNSEKLWKLKIKRKPLKKASSLGNHCSVDCSGKLWLKTYTGCHPRSNTSVFHLLQVSRYFYTHRILLLPHWKRYSYSPCFLLLIFMLQNCDSNVSFEFACDCEHNISTITNFKSEQIPCFSKFWKTCHSRKNKYSRNVQKLVIRENKYSRNEISFGSRK